MNPMGLLRTYALVFLVGWGLWLWLDKAGPEYAPQPPMAPYGAGPMPGYPGQPGYGPGGPPPAPGVEGSTVQDFQHAVDLLKAGRYQQAFTWLWRRQSWVLAGVLTVFAAVVSPGTGRIVTRLRGRSGGADRPAG